MAWPSRTPTEQTASRTELRFSAARMPAGTATTSARARPAAVSCSVAGRVWAISVSAGTWCLKESPKSPRTARLRKRTYCIHSGSSRPSSARSCRTSSSRASSGRSSRVGSPVRWRSAKTITETPSRTPRLCSRRRATKLNRLRRAWGAISRPPTPSEADFGQPYRLVAAGRPLEPGVDAVDVHLLVAEDVRRIVTDQPEELAVELLALVRVHLGAGGQDRLVDVGIRDRKSTRLNSSHQIISYAVFCLKKKIQRLATCLLAMLNGLPSPESFLD